MAYVNVVEDVYLFEIQHEGAEVGLAGVSDSGVVYLSGDLHVNGRFAALLAAPKAQVSYIATPSGEVLFPAEWLRCQCLHDVDRLHVIDNLSSFALNH